MALRLRMAILLLAAGCVDLGRPAGLVGSLPRDGGAEAGRPEVPPVDAAPDEADAAEPDALAGDGGEPDQAPGETAPEDAPLAEAPDGEPATIDADGDAEEVTAPPLASNGTGCNAGSECASGICADGVCCATTCTGCRACNLAGSGGICTAVPAGQDPRGFCARDPESTCQRAGGCNGRGACALHAATTVCAAQVCNGSTETAARRCDGMGICLPAASSRSCGAYLCGAGACATSCTMASQCSAGNTCWAGGCVATASAPVLVWRFDELTGSVATDATGGGWNGTYTGNSGQPSPSSDVPTLQFPNPRSRAFVRSSRHAVLLGPMPGNGQWVNNVTLMAWYRATTVGSVNAASDIVSAGDVYYLRLRSSDIEFGKKIAGSHVKCYAAVGTQLDGRWHHVAAVTTPAGMRVYYDGVERCSNNIGGDIAYDRGDELWAGRHGNGNTNWDFEGNIDEVRIYNRALSAAEIAALAAGGN